MAIIPIGTDIRLRRVPVGNWVLIGVNVFHGADGSPTRSVEQVMRSTDEEKRYAIASLAAFQERNREPHQKVLQNLHRVSLAGGNTFEALLEATKVCSLGQISATLFEVGGRYRRNM